MGQGDQKFRLLMVEDSLTQAFVLKRLLLDHGFAVATAANGVEALAQLEKAPFDLVISDVEMPEMDGYELCGRIKSHPDWKGTPVVLLTTLSEPENIIKGLAARADYYLTKPYTPTYLVERLRGLLADSVGAAEEEPEAELDVAFHGKRYKVSTGRRQMLNLLLSTYENSVQQNRELIRTQYELNQKNKQLWEQQGKLEEANLRLEALATEDGLTRLKNVRAFRERFNEEFQRAERYRMPLSVILLDVDQFKSFNDTFGHPAGDGVLREVGAKVKEASRNTDFPARYGGEEFIIMLPNTEESEALSLAERMRKLIESGPWEKRGITASFGVASLRTGVGSGEELVTRADQALYHSKRTGRNRVTSFSGEHLRPA